MMKPKLLSLLALVSSFAIPTVSHAQVLFNENLDGAPYFSDKALNDGDTPVTGFNVLDHGAWGVNENTVSVSTEQWLSAGRSLKLAGANAQFLATFGATGAAATPTRDAMEIAFAFNLSSTASLFEFVVRDEAGENLVIVGISSTIRGLFGDGFQTTGAVSANTWYNLKVTLSGDPGSGSDQFSVSLYDALGTTQIGSTMIGAFYAPSAGTGYSYMSGIFSPQNAGADRIYIDNISAVAVPEGSHALYLAIGGAFCFGLFRARRSKMGVA